MDYQALKNLIIADENLDFATMSDAEIATAINARTVQIDREIITGDQLIEEADLAELAALDAARTAAFWGLAAKPAINIASGSNTRTILASLFGGGTNTRSNLLALAASQVSANYATQTLGRPVMHHDVAEARKL